MQLLRSIVKGMVELLLELSDQNAYARHLEEHGVAHSGREWRKFADQRFRSRYQQVKCC